MTGGHFILVMVVFTAKAISIMFVWRIPAFEELGFLHPVILFGVESALSNMFYAVVNLGVQL